MHHRVHIGGGRIAYFPQHFCGLQVWDFLWALQEHILGVNGTVIAPCVFDCSRSGVHGKHEFFRALIGGEITSRADTLRFLRLLRSRMDPDKSAVLVQLALPEDDEFLRNRWHYGVDRLEVALRNFFGAELAGMRILVSVLPDDRIYLLCCTMLGEDGPGEDVDMTQLIIDHAQGSIEHVREYLGMHLRLASIRVLPTLVELAQE